jgi:hypothetical protein
MKTIVAAVFALGILSSPAHALCSYRGEPDVRTTLRQEFQDARWVVRARVLSASDHWSDEGDSWTVYRLKVRRTFKGSPAKRLTFFTFRDSSGFYLDRGSKRDIGGEYLLFLNPAGRSRPAGLKAADLVDVNYTCGQSQPWSDVTPDERRSLGVLSGHR